MRSLLILYLIDRWRMSDAKATTTYGAYTAMAFGASIAGGLLADRFFGARRMMMLGGILIIFGYATLTAQDFLGRTETMGAKLLFLALALIVIGTGFFKPTVSAQIGALYPPKDKRRESGFYLFYVGINVGAAAAPLVCGYVGQTYGWGYGFGLAMLGIGLGMAVVYGGRKELPPSPVLLSGPRLTIATLGFPLVGVIVVFGLLSFPDLVGWVLVFALGCGLASLGRFMALSATTAERNNLVVALVLILVAAVFWSLNEQGGSTLNLFAARMVDLHAGPLVLKPAQTQFFNPAFIVVGAPLFAVLWRSLAARGWEPSPPAKFALGLLLAGGAFAALAVGAAFTPAGAKVSLIWLVAAYMVNTAGELCLATPGYATMIRLAPTRVVTLVMGLWLFGASAGNFIGAKVAGFTADHGSSLASLPGYAPIFGLIALGAGALSLLLMLVARPLARMIRDDDGKQPSPYLAAEEPLS